MVICSQGICMASQLWMSTVVLRNMGLSSWKMEPTAVLGGARTRNDALKPMVDVANWRKAHQYEGLNTYNM